MQYKTIQELYLAIGVAGSIIVVFLALFTYLVVSSDKKRTQQMDDVVDKLSTLQINDNDFKVLMQGLTETVKELSTTNRIVADTVSRLDFYNKDLRKKLDKHDDKSDKILDAVIR